MSSLSPSHCDVNDDTFPVISIVDDGVDLLCTLENNKNLQIPFKNSPVVDENDDKFNENTPKINQNQKINRPLPVKFGLKKRLDMLKLELRHIFKPLYLKDFYVPLTQFKQVALEKSNFFGLSNTEFRCSSHFYSKFKQTHLGSKYALSFGLQIQKIEFGTPPHFLRDYNMILAYPLLPARFVKPKTPSKTFSFNNPALNGKLLGRKISDLMNFVDADRKKVDYLDKKKIERIKSGKAIWRGRQKKNLPESNGGNLEKFFSKLNEKNSKDVGGMHEISKIKTENAKMVVKIRKKENQKFKVSGISEKMKKVRKRQLNDIKNAKRREKRRLERILKESLAPIKATAQHSVGSTGSGRYKTRSTNLSPSEFFSASYKREILQKPQLYRKCPRTRPTMIHNNRVMSSQQNNDEESLLPLNDSDYNFIINNSGIDDTIFTSILNIIDLDESEQNMSIPDEVNMEPSLEAIESEDNELLRNDNINVESLTPNLELFGNFENNNDTEVDINNDEVIQLLSETFKDIDIDSILSPSYIQVNKSEERGSSDENIYVKNDLQLLQDTPIISPPSRSEENMFQIISTPNDDRENLCNESDDEIEEYIWTKIKKHNSEDKDVEIIEAIDKGVGNSHKAKQLEILKHDKVYTSDSETVYSPSSSWSDVTESLSPHANDECLEENDEFKISCSNLNIEIENQNTSLVEPSKNVIFSSLKINENNLIQEENETENSSTYHPIAIDGKNSLANDRENSFSNEEENVKFLKIVDKKLESKVLVIVERVDITKEENSSSRCLISGNKKTQDHNFFVEELSSDSDLENNLTHKEEYKIENSSEPKPINNENSLELDVNKIPSSDDEESDIEIIQIVDKPLDKKSSVIFESVKEKNSEHAPTKRSRRLYRRNKKKQERQFLEEDLLSDSDLKNSLTQKDEYKIENSSKPRPINSENSLGLEFNKIPSSDEEESDVEIIQIVDKPLDKKSSVIVESVKEKNSEHALTKRSRRLYRRNKKKQERQFFEENLSSDSDSDYVPKKRSRHLHRRSGKQQLRKSPILVDLTLD